jgi:FkbM family methyltransferase
VVANQQQTKLFQRSEELRKKIASFSQKQSQSSQKNDFLARSAPTSSKTISDATVVITPNEVNQRHGTGVLINKIFGDSSNVISIRAQNHYGGEHTFGEISVLLPNPEQSRQKAYAQILSFLEGSTVKQALCLPYHADEILLAIAVKDLFNVPLCTYIMDDNNVYGSGIPDELMEELLQKSDLRLAISSELKQAYEKKYNSKFWILPPIVSNHLILSNPNKTRGLQRDPKVGILVGNVWGQKWLDLLRETVKGTGITIHWYCNAGSKSSWLSFDRQELEEDGIVLFDPLPEEQLARKLPSYTFAILPSGTLDELDDNRSVAQLSLPSRVPFILATSGTPIIVLGHPQTTSARFVKRFEVGEVSAYNAEAFQQAVAAVVSDEAQMHLRKNAADIANIFSDANIEQWIWNSLDKGEPDDFRFEQLMPASLGDYAYYVDPPVPKEIYSDFVPVYRALRRLKWKGYQPDFVIDVGASTGIWSHTVNYIFPEARYILVEPLLSRHDALSRKIFIENHSNFETVEAIASNYIGATTLQVSSDLYNSSLFELNHSQFSEEVDIVVVTLDRIAERKKIEGRGILKMDVQFAEHLVLEGASELLKQVDLIITELSFLKHHPAGKTFLEMLDLLNELGFRYYDDAGEWRLPTDGTLHNKDGLFVRQSLFLYTMH